MNYANSSVKPGKGSMLKKNFAPDNLEERAKGMGATDGPTAIGVNPHRSEYDCYLEKTGKTTPEDISNIPAVIHGIAMEPVVFEMIKTKLKIPARRDNLTHYHPKYDWMFMHIDGRYTSDNRIIEIKCPSTHMRDFYGVEGTDQIPQIYIAQATHMLAIEEKCKAIEFFIYFHGEILRYTIRRKERLIEIYMKALLRFWGHVQENIPPMPRNNEDVTHMYFKTNHKLIENNVGLEIFILNHIKEKAEHKKQKEKLIDDNIYIKREVGNNDGVLMSNGKKTLVSRVELSSLDKHMLEAKYPDTYKEHCNLFNEKELKDKNPEIFEECSNIKQSSRLILPRK
ncbi:MAG TPA: hypothetical protein EYO81_00830 [Gammaproteobacteria bacterium]|nr:hypothetical protein [Gammaproteobacteria bacterium]